MRSSPTRRSGSSTTSSARTGRPTSRPASAPAERATGPASAARRAGRGGLPHRSARRDGRRLQRLLRAVLRERSGQRVRRDGERRLRIRRPVGSRERPPNDDPASPIDHGGTGDRGGDPGRGGDRHRAAGQRQRPAAAREDPEGRHRRLEGEAERRRGRWRRRDQHQGQAGPALRTQRRRPEDRAAPHARGGAARCRGPGPDADRLGEASDPPEHAERPGHHREGSWPAEARVVAEGGPDRDDPRRPAEARRGRRARSSSRSSARSTSRIRDREARPMRTDRFTQRATEAIVSRAAARRVRGPRPAGGRAPAAGAGRTARWRRARGPEPHRRAARIGRRGTAR